jgi:hypothetical protein
VSFRHAVELLRGESPSLAAPLYLPGPHRGVWNVEAVAASIELILCESLIDAMTFWCAGLRNVTTSYGALGFTADHLEATLVGPARSASQRNDRAKPRTTYNCASDLVSVTSRRRPLAPFRIFVRRLK